jgi:peptide/nickel transport system substrate-binding protein
VNFTLPTRESCTNLPVSDGCPYFNQQSEGSDTRQPFEKRISKAYKLLTSTNDSALKNAAIKEIQRELTENAYSIGTVQSPAALLVNKRVKNAHPGTPVFMFEWAEDSVIRERLWIPKKDQMKELYQGTVAEYK